jgi:ribose transport system substrate-binding protein
MRYRTTARNGAIALIAVASLALTACSAGEGTEAGGSSEGSTERIGIAIPTANQTYWTSWMNGAQDEADKLGVEVSFADGRNDAQTMNDQVNTLLVSGIDGLVVASVDPDANIVSVQAGTDAGIPVITANRNVNEAYGGIGGANPQIHVGFNDVQIGDRQAELVVQACEDVDPCNVVEIVGTLGSSPQKDRSQGLRDGLEGHDNISIVEQRDNDFDPAKAIDVTQALLQAVPDISVITAQEDPSAVGVVQVLKEQGRQDDIKVVGIGGSIDGVKSVEAGDLFGTVKVSAHADGATAVDAIVAVLRDESLDIDDSGDRPTLFVPAVVVTKENAADNPGDW